MEERVPKAIAITPRQLAVGRRERRQEEESSADSGKKLPNLVSRRKRDPKKDGRRRQPGEADEATPEEAEAEQRFRDMASRRSAAMAAAVAATTPPTRISRRAARRLAHERRLRLLRLAPKFARRGIRRFHARFRPWQILAFYIGVPVVISLFCCLFVMFTPKGERVRTTSPKAPPAGAFIDDVLAAVQNGDVDRAEVAVSKLVELYPKDPRSFIAQGAVLAQQHKYSEARVAFQTALNVSPDLVPAKMNLAELEFAVGAYAEATKYYEAVSGELGSNPLVWFRLYLCYELSGRTADARELTAKNRFRPQSVEWFFVKASEALKAGDRGAAQKYVTSARTLFGKKAEAYETSLRNIGWLK